MTQKKRLVREVNTTLLLDMWLEIYISDDNPDLRCYKP